MLARILRRVEPPVQAGVVDRVAVPGLRDVDFAVCRPGEGFVREEPECGPDAGGAGEGKDGGEGAVWVGEALVRDEAGGGVFSGGVGCGGGGDGAKDEEVVGRAC